MVIGLGSSLGQICRLLGLAGVRDQSDAQLLERFLQQRDQTAFAGLLERHGPMVWNVCRRVLAQDQDADDAFQATFLVLMRKARSIRKHEALGSWLYGVACRVAFQARAAAQRHRTLIKELQPMTTTQPATEEHGPEFQLLLDDELNQLPNKYRAPLVLCYLQGKTNEQAAQELGWPAGSMSRRLAKARELLRGRLVRRGLTLSIGTWAALLAKQGCGAPLPAALTTKTMQAILCSGAGTGFSAPVTALAERIIRSMFLAKLKMSVGLTLVLIGLLTTGVVVHQDILAQALPDKGPQAEAKKPPKETAGLPVDRQGDALPPGALARLGTLRLRHGGQVYAVAYSPDGKILASGARDKVIRLWDATTRKELRQLHGHQNGIMAIAFSPEGKRLISASEDKTLRLWDVATGTAIGQFQGHEAAVTAVVMHSDGKTIISAGLDKTIRFWEVPGKGMLAGKHIRCLKGNLGYLYSLALSPDSKTLAAGNGTGRIALWDLATGKESGELLGHQREVNGLAFAGNDHLASAGNDARLWHLPTGKVEWQAVQGHSFDTVAVSRDQTLVAAAGHGDYRPVVVYDRETKREWKNAALHDGPLAERDMWAPRGWVREGIKTLAFSPDAKSLAGGSFDSRLHQWNLATGKETRFPQEHLGAVVSLAFSPDGKLLATGSRDGILRVWGVSTAIERWRASNSLFDSTNASVGSVAFSPDERTLAAVTSAGDLRLWDARTGQEKSRLDAARCFAFSKDGKLLATGGPHGTVHVYEIASGATLLRVEKMDYEVHHLALSPDRKRLVAGCYDPKSVKEARGVLRLWDLTKKKFEREVAAHRYSVSSVAFSPDGRRIVSTGTNESQVRLWDGALEDPRPTLTPPELPRAYTAAISPDGKVLAIGSNKVVVLWDLAKGNEVRRFDGHLHVVEALAFSADGRLLASGSTDSTVLIWDVTGRLAQEKPAPLSLVRTELDQLCRDLADPDEGRAASAQRTLVAGAKDALPYLQTRVQHWAGTEPGRVARWLAELDHDQFKVREQATAELERLGPAVAPDLEKAMVNASSAEARRRLKKLLARLDKGAEAFPTPPPERVFAVLERIGTAEARQILTNVAKGESQSAWAKAARIALKRLGD